MGMFDYLRSELPEHEKHPDGWQTKDTPEQYLQNYIIGADKKLYLDAWTDGKERDRRKPVDFTGSIDFYDHETPEGTTGDHKVHPMRTWTAFFENGVMFKLIDRGFGE